ncbi:MAG TPA: TetR/AcrR family transcriptional regulator [Intrasporangium sp.]|uniref:TetR/AcrR family transcriptional regulator n=1 Tax=Intrasporangium sp. TaxID=1925024 RepID=UPI002D78ACBB|nr:TetR/AcrR family transcriptional regulator [Intrasporangium sp.]HET7397600.1 TetR/AcrR family transcriptional regulator [Intrasporangium sp.]
MSRRDEILDVAAALLEEEGPDALTMRELAGRMGIRAPSLYKHVRDKDEIVAGLQERALTHLARHLAAADPGLGGLADAYRSWAMAHPKLYEVATRRPLARERIAPGVESAAAAPIVAAAGGDEHLARALWALAHGLVDLELSDRFPPGADLDATWRTALRAFSGGMPPGAVAPHVGPHGEGTR